MYSMFVAILFVIRICSNSAQCLPRWWLILTYQEYYDVINEYEPKINLRF